VASAEFVNEDSDMRATRPFSQSIQSAFAIPFGIRHSLRHSPFPSAFAIPFGIRHSIRHSPFHSKCGILNRHSAVLIRHSAIENSAFGDRQSPFTAGS
jgi:hypothetical protein